MESISYCVFLNGKVIDDYNSSLDEATMLAQHLLETVRKVRSIKIYGITKTKSWVELETDKYSVLLQKPERIYVHSALS